MKCFPNQKHQNNTENLICYSFQKLLNITGQKEILIYSSAKDITSLQNEVYSARY